MTKKNRKLYQELLNSCFQNQSMKYIVGTKPGQSFTPRKNSPYLLFL